MPTVASLTARISADIGGLEQGLKQAGASVANLGQQIKRVNPTAALDAGMQKTEERAKKFAASLNAIGTRLSIGVTAPLVLLGRSAVNIAADFEQSQNVFQVVTRATSAEMAQMAKLARELGADLTLPATSAVDAAQAMTQLGKAGLSVENSMGAARGTLQLAAAAEVEAARAADIAAGALNAFRLSGDQATRVADLLAGASIAAQGEISEMAVALQQASAQAALSGQTVEDTVTSIAALAQAGIRGSDAGTSLRVMLQRLQPQTKEAAKLMKALGVEATDARGQFLPLRDIIQKYSRALKDATPAQRQSILQTIFGTDAQRAAAILLTTGEAFDAVAGAVTRQGTAAEIAGAKNKGLRGALDAMQSAFETAAESAITPFIQDLADLARGAGEVMNAFSRLPEPVRKAVVAFAALAALAGPTILFLGQFKAATTALGLTLPGVLTGLRGIAAFLTGPWGLAIAAAAAIILTLKKAWDENLGGMRDTWNEWFPRMQTLLDVGWSAIVEGAKGYFLELGKAWSAMWKAAGEEFGGFVGRIFRWLGNLPGMGEFLKRLDFYRLATATPEQLLGGPVTPYTGEKPGGGAAKTGGGAGIDLGTTEETPYQKQLKSLRELEAQLQRTARAYAAGLSPAMRDLMSQFSLLSQEELREAALLTRANQAAQEAIDLRKEFVQQIRSLELQLAQEQGRGGMGLLEASKRFAGVATPEELKRIAELNTAIAVTRERNEAVRKAEQDRKATLDRLNEASKQYSLELLRMRGTTDLHALSVGELGKEFKELDKETQVAFQSMLEWRKVVETARKEQERLRETAEALRSMAEGVKSTFAQAFADIQNGFGAMVRSIVDGVKQMLVQIAAEYLAAQATNAILGVVGNLIGVSFPKLGSTLGTATRRQHGGDVRAGRPYWVGEEAPELFVPPRSGRIMNQQQLAGAGAATYNITVNFSGPMGPNTRQHVQAGLSDALQEAERARRRSG